MRTGLRRLFTLGALLAAGSAHAQLSGSLVKGQFGLQSGTQPPEGVVATLFAYDYYATTIKGPNGDSLATSGSLNLIAAPGLNLWLVSPWKLLGANYGAVLSLWGASASVDAPRFNASQSTYGFGDMYVKPVELGWHTPHLDAITGFAIWIPTGRYTPGGDNNTGQGQWGYELTLGATAWLEKEHHLNLATQIFFDLYSDRRGAVGPSNTQLHTGDTLTLQGGLGYQLLGGGLNFGIPYFVQWKVTEDTLPPGVGAILPAIDAAKSFSAGVGAEVALYWSTTDGVNARWVQGIGGKNTTNGASFFLLYNHLFSLPGEKKVPDTLQSPARSPELSWR